MGSLQGNRLLGDGLPVDKGESASIEPNLLFGKDYLPDLIGKSFVRLLRNGMRPPWVAGDIRAPQLALRLSSLRSSTQRMANEVSEVPSVSLSF